MNITKEQIIEQIKNYIKDEITKNVNLNNLVDKSITIQNIINSINITYIKNNGFIVNIPTNINSIEYLLINSYTDINKLVLKSNNIFKIKLDLYKTSKKITKILPEGNDKDVLDIVLDNINLEQSIFSMDIDKLIVLLYKLKKNLKYVKTKLKK